MPSFSGNSLLGPGSPLVDRFPIAFLDQSPGGLRTHRSGSRLCSFQTRSRMQTFSVPSRSLPAGLRLWRHFSGLGCHLRLPIFSLNQTPRLTSPPRAPPGVCSPPTVVDVAGMISEKSWTSRVIASSPMEGKVFPARTLIRRYLQTKEKREDEREPTYREYSHPVRRGCR